MRTRLKTEHAKLQKASASLFFASVMIALLILQLCVLGAFKEAEFQSGAAVKLEQESERMLSRYDRDLYERYGLWGFEGKNADDLRSSPDVKNSVSDLSDSAEIYFYPESALFEAVGLRPQILKFMRLRFPLSAAESISSLIRDAGRSREDYSVAKNALTSARNDFSGLCKYFFDEDDGEDDENSEDIKESESEADDHTDTSDKEETDEKNKENMNISSEFSDLVRESAEEALVINVSEAKGGESFVAGLLKLINDSEKFLDFEAEAPYEKLCIDEYALRMFPNLLHRRPASLSESDKLNLRGKALDSGSAAQVRSEEILTGLTGSEAEMKVFKDICFIRFALRFLSSLSNREKMNNYLIKAEAISSVLLIISGGKLKLDPQALSYFICAVECLYLSTDDASRLIRGERVQLIPDSKKISIKAGYISYLSFLFLLKDEGEILENISAGLKKEFGDSFYTAVRAKLCVLSPYTSIERSYGIRRQYAVYENSEE